MPKHVLHSDPIPRLYVRLEGDSLYAPETTVPVGTMRESCVPPAMRELVGHVFTYHEVLPDDWDVVENVVPDGALRLIFELGSASPSARVIGPNAKPVELRMRGDMHALSVALRPGAALAIWGIPAHELAGYAVPWQDVAVGAQCDLPERLAEAPCDSARVSLLLNALKGSLRELNISEWHCARRAAALFRGPAAERSVRAVARTIGLGERRLQQVFRAHVGLPPRTWNPLARLHECLRLLRQPAPLPWHALAVDVASTTNRT